MVRWHAETGKPYGVYGITLPMKKSSGTTMTPDDAMSQAINVLSGAEDQTQMTVGKELLYDHLPRDVQTRVVWRPNYWLTGEAISVDTQSVGLFGNEMHSPIMCTGHTIPAIVCRWAEQTSKGTMWKDIGLGDWLFDTDNPSEVIKIVPAVLEIAKHPEQAKEKSKRARLYVQQRQRETMAVLRRSLLNNDASAARGGRPRTHRDGPASVGDEVFKL